MNSCNEHVLIEGKGIAANDQEIILEAASPDLGDQYGETKNDLSDMQRLGKKQEFRVRCTYQQSRIVFEQCIDSSVEEF